jgi:membrane protein implicated in regulation of membrane protease activity
MSAESAATKSFLIFLGAWEFIGLVGLGFLSAYPARTWQADMIIVSAYALGFVILLWRARKTDLANQESALVGAVLPNAELTKSDAEQSKKRD